MNRLTPAQMAERLAQDIPDGSYVNLGIGMPVMVANYVPDDREVIYHSENGILGVGPTPAPGTEDPDLINAAKQYVTLIKGGCYFDTAESFAMMRGGHLDIAILGGFQVSARGDLANWATDNEKYPPAVGGAMDLAIGAKAVYVLMRHTNKDGSPKILDQCTFPLTGSGVVRRIYTDLAVLEVTDAGIAVVEILAGNDFDAVQAVTATALLMSGRAHTADRKPTN